MLTTSSVFQGPQLKIKEDEFGNLYVDDPNRKRTAETGAAAATKYPAHQSLFPKEPLVEKEKKGEGGTCFRSPSCLSKQ